MGSSLFMPDQDVFHPPLALGNVKSVVDREDGAARITKNRVHAMSTQSIHQGMGTADPQ